MNSQKNYSVSLIDEADLPTPYLNKIPEILKRASKHSGVSCTNCIIHPYQDELGDVRFVKYRPIGTDGKKYGLIQYAINDQNCLVNLSEVYGNNPKPLYNLINIERTLEYIPDTLIFIVEGEKQVDFLNVLGFVATTGGSSSDVANRDWSCLIPANNIIIWQDNDKAGDNWLVKVIAELEAQGQNDKYRVIDEKLPLFNFKDGDGSDIYDWIYPIYEEEGTIGAIKAIESLINDSASFKSITTKDDDKNDDSLFIKADWVVIDGSPAFKAFNVVGEVRPADKNEYFVVIRFYDNDGVLQTEFMPSDFLFSDNEALKWLSKKGIKASKKYAKSLLEYLENGYDSIKKQGDFHLVNKGGWAKKMLPNGEFDNFSAFVTPQKVYGSQHFLHNKPVVQESKGTLQDYQKQVLDLIKDQNIMLFVLCLAFGSPMSTLLDSDGVMLHLYGKSGKGKTTAIKLLQSLFGRVSSPLNWRATFAHISAKSYECNDSVLVLDEIGLASDGDSVSDIVYLIANGASKATANVNSEAKEVKTFKLNCLSTGEYRIENYVIQKGGKEPPAGAMLRVIQMPIGLTNSGFVEYLPNGYKNISDYANAVNKSFDDNQTAVYGTAFPAFLEKLTEQVFSNKDFIPMLKQRANDFVAKFEVQGQAMRVLKRFAVLAVAGELATEFGITGYEAGRMQNSVEIIFKKWLDENDAETDYETRRALEYWSLVAEKRSTMFAPIKVSPNDPLLKDPIQVSGVQSKGWRSFDYIYIQPRIFKEICKEAGLTDHTAVLEALDNADILDYNKGTDTAKSKRYQKSVKIGDKPTWCYCLDINKLTGSQPAQENEQFIPELSNMDSMNEIPF